MVILSVTIDGYSISAHWLFYQCLLVILLVSIDGYYIGDY
jgi:hypothetical protein